MKAIVVEKNFVTASKNYNKIIMGLLKAFLNFFVIRKNTKKNKNFFFVFNLIFLILICNI